MSTSEKCDTLKARLKFICQALRNLLQRRRSYNWNYRSFFKQTLARALCFFQSVFLNITKSQSHQLFTSFGAFLCRKNVNLFKFPKPIGSMYGIFTYIYHKNQPNVGKYAIHGSYGKRHVAWWFTFRIGTWLVALGQKIHPTATNLVIPFMQNVAVRAEMPGGFLPPLSLKKPSLRPIGSMYGIFTYICPWMWPFFT